MRKKLKLYVWHGVLYDYTPGIAFALATSPEEAKELIGLVGNWDGLRLDGVEVEVYDKPEGFYLHGGG